ncbi:MAG: hypothetical protein COV74_05840 [Candidatus Omnitrophica bacterium CG11_big_fil_rev_8_21_14_0_20_45_26]|uniref:Rod shape-determining protein MreD n=1 Tax=Candidatus Abzuiibacterium crystallinum TaxID=1974748 RepID=A0A2H0LPA9_9BACT|nr:MAG: hypothetical protein COV74_05840 [Candidatus Omnitrophica bacterium CG11_big_fil_rev_8_21_14_0_20_45_26]PIW64090.1 MAG: hypothetical protein COW12_07575 [Candidatus Omnitrophica bacterium CG12_big_fil_rev_8_21_14_0_65_45_16]
MRNIRFITLVLIILGGALSRLIPHYWNMTPLIGMALFGGAHFQNRRTAMGMVLAAMILSDLFIGYHSLLPLVYALLLGFVWVGTYLKENKKPLLVLTAAFGSSVIFFLITNFAVWLTSGLYPLTGEGLTRCFIYAIPFFQHQLLGDILFTAVFFGGFALAEHRFSVLKKTSASLVA